MSDSSLHYKEAMRLVAEAGTYYASNNVREALPLLRQAVLRFFEAERQTLQDGREPPRKWLLERASACRLCADLLVQDNEYAEAAGIYQEAVDLFGRLPGDKARQQAHHCAQQALAVLEALRTGPHDRLYLLIAHYERQQQQLALQPGSEVQQAECCAHIAGILMRRDRPTEAAKRFHETLKLYARSPHSSDVMRACAECHHRLGGLYANSLNRPIDAARHYRTAIELYGTYEVPVYGVQQSRALCIAALADLQRSLPHQELPLE